VVAQQARILDDGAKATTRRVRRDHRNGIDPHEETLTQNFVSDYVAKVRRSKMRARVNEFTKRQEARLYGADIALWFVNATGQFAGIYLQAKVLRRDDTYRGLNHSNRWGSQHQTLIDAGNRDGVLSGYAFYNGLSGSQPARSVCGHGDGAPDINGINIASATLMTPHLKRAVRAGVVPPAAESERMRQRLTFRQPCSVLPSRGSNLKLGCSAARSCRRMWARSRRHSGSARSSYRQTKIATTSATPTTGGSTGVDRAACDGPTSILSSQQCSSGQRSRELDELPFLVRHHR
jgi:hypothetical protein